MLSTSRIIELGTLATYLGILLWIGVRSARRIRTSTDYTLAGRNVPWVVLLATMAATMIGGGASVGTVSRVYQIGISAVLVTCAWHLQLIFMGLWAAPRLRELNLITVADYFELRFGSLARALAVVNSLVFIIGALVAQMVAMATITSIIIDIPYGAALLIGATVTIFYSTVGGIRAVVQTDVLQFVILVAGMASASAMLVIRNGGIPAIAHQVGLEHFDVTGHWSATHVISLFVAFLLGELFIPPYTVRCFIARDDRQARLGVAGSGIFLLLFLPVVTFVLGISAQIDPEVRNAVEERKIEVLRSAADRGEELTNTQAANRAVQVAFPALVRTTFHPAFAGIMIAAMMSSADSLLSCHATVVMEDIYRQYINREARDHSLLRVAQWATFLTGIAAAAFAFFFQDIIAVLVFVYDCWAPAMVLPFLVGLFWYRPERIYAVVASMVAGSTSTIVWIWLGSPWELGAALLGFAIAVVVFFTTLPLTSRFKLGRLFEPHDTSAPSEERST